MGDCIFCKVVKGDLPHYKVYEDKHVLAFLDASPATKGHTLVIPKKHVKTVDKLSEKEMMYLGKGVLKISKALLKFNQGMNIMQNNNSIAGQEVDHVHFHLVPRNKTDKGRFSWKGESYAGKPDELTAQKIKSFLK